MILKKVQITVYFRGLKKKQRYLFAVLDFLSPLKQTRICAFSVSLVSTDGIIPPKIVFTPFEFTS